MTLGAAYEARGEYGRAVETFKRFGALGAYYRPAAAALLAAVGERGGAVAVLHHRTHRMGTENAARLYAAQS